MEFLDHRQQLVEDRLAEVIGHVEGTNHAERMGHVTLADGKRVRPMVTILACEAVGGEAESAVDFGVGIELVHTASLVIDDIIDRSTVRRGVDSNWTKYGYGSALVTSDGLMGEAFALFSGEPEATQSVAEAIVELGEGEAMELADGPTNFDEYMELARRKTGALFRAAAELGAIAAAADPSTVESLGEFAEGVGIAFQIRDDVLDATAEATALGKPTGTDADMDRPSVVHVTDLSPTEANQRARAEARQAKAALDRVDIADDRAEAYLRDLAEFVVGRER